jgi:hypothetical protein
MSILPAKAYPDFTRWLALIVGLGGARSSLLNSSVDIQCQLCRLCYGI